MRSPIPHEHAAPIALKFHLSRCGLAQTISTLFHVNFSMDSSNEFLELIDAHIANFSHHGVWYRLVKDQSLSLMP